MKPAHRIRQHGFSSWYQRELTHSHLHLVLLLLSAVALLSAAEVFSGALPLANQLLLLVCAFASAWIGVWALRRYLFLLMHAEHVAHQAVCPGCQSYAQWNLLADANGGRRWRVQCRQCERRWDIDT